MASRRSEAETERPAAAAKSWADEEEEEPRGARCSCSCGQLSCLSWGFLAFLIALSAAIVAHNPRDALLLPGFFLAPLLVLWLVWGRKLRQEIPMDLVLQSFGVWLHARVKSRYAVLSLRASTLVDAVMLMGLLNVWMFGRFWQRLAFSRAHAS